MTDAKRDADELARWVNALEAQNRQLARELALARKRLESRKADVIEKTASRLLMATYLTGARLGAAEAADNAVHRAVIFANRLDAYFETTPKKGGSNG